MTGRVADVESRTRDQKTRDGTGNGRGGPRPGIDRVQRAAIIALVRAGAPPTTAAVKCGVPRRTHEDWLRRGRMADGPEPCKRYVEDIEHAIEDWKYGRIQAVEAAEEDDWRAAMALLERRFPQEFGLKKQIEGKLQVQAVPLVAWEKLTVDEAEQLVALLRKASPAPDDPAINDTARPALELVAGPDVIEAAE